MNDFALRACRYEDLAQVLAIEETSFKDSAYRMPDFVYFMERAKDGFLIAEEGGCISGYVIAIEEGGAGMIQSIAVSPESRRRGIGEVLMKSAVDRLSRNERISLLVDPNNAAAISLYRKFSFRETGRIIKEYYRNGADAIEMVKTRAASEDEMDGEDGVV